MLRNLPGGVPEPHELIGREHLIDLLWKQLAGTNVFLVAPRRFGKTGVMRHVCKMPLDGYVPVYLEVEDVHSPQDFAAELLASLAGQARLRKLLTQLKSLPAQVSDLLAERIDEVGAGQFKIKLRDALGEKWKTLSGRLVREMEKADGKVISIIDEFPQMIENVVAAEGLSTARSLLGWFRSLRMRQKDELRRFRFILAGSTGIDADSLLFDVYKKARGKGASELEFREILADLECDLYVSLGTATNEYFFQMEIMKAWWRRFYAKLKPAPKK